MPEVGRELMKDVATNLLVSAAEIIDNQDLHTTLK